MAEEVFGIVVVEDFAVAGVADLPLKEMANLPKQDTGIDGMIYVSTREGNHGPRIKWFPERPGNRRPCLIVTIEPSPRVINKRIPDILENRVSGVLVRWVQKNSDKLLNLWKNGTSWTRHEVSALLDTLEKVE